ncbi:MAG: hypothetical protein JSS17_17820 [Proteobacteria bacterium]|nr:hypothetical protein [Pseudomonadota bacterium]
MAHPATQRATLGAPCMAQPGRTLDPIQRQAAIENALSTALYFMRRTGDAPADRAAHLWAATARAHRALSLLKQASTDAREVGRAGQ